MKVWNKRHGNAPEGAVYVGRGTPWGNPFVMFAEHQRDMVCDEFEAKVLPALDVTPLIGKDLVCWCAPKRCHADALLRAAQGIEPARREGGSIRRTKARSAPPMRPNLPRRSPMTSPQDEMVALQSLIPYLEVHHCSTKAVTDAVEALRHLQRENSELREALEEVASARDAYLQSDYESEEEMSAGSRLDKAFDKARAALSRRDQQPDQAASA